MKKLLQHKEYFIIGFITIFLILVSSLSMISIKQLQGQARVVNYCGIVRGATQKLIKEELMHVQDDPLIERLSSIIDNLQTGEGPHDLVVLNSQPYLDLLDRIQDHWHELKNEIYLVRQGKDPHDLFESSQAYFELVNDTVFAAEAYSESQVYYIMILLIGINFVFIALLIIFSIFVVRGVTVSRRARFLDNIAFVDPMTQINNRASCDQKINSIIENPPSADIAVVMFDMNNLKITNDSLGHKKGDIMIIQFARILKDATKNRGFIGRYGGDEFIAFLDNATLALVQEYLAKINDEVSAYNAGQMIDYEKISFAAGHTIGNLSETSLDDMIYESDKSMYEIKHKMKKGLL